MKFEDHRIQPPWSNRIRCRPSKPRDEGLNPSGGANNYPVKRQKRVWSCGAAVVRNVFRIYGVRVAEHEIWPHSETTKEFGTSEHGILNALKVWEFSPRQHKFSDKEKAWEWLHGTLSLGYPVILAVENWEHWVLAIGSLGDLGVAIFDSSNFKVNTYENGCHVWSKKKLLYKWWNDRKHVDDERIYAISVKR